MKQPISRVIVISDCKDVAFNEIKLIIDKECRKLGIIGIDIDLVSVEEFSIINAAFLTRLIAEQCLPNTVLSIIVNPKRSRSERIYGELKGGIIFFGANTGALTWLIKDLGLECLYEIKDPGFMSFGGKFVHAPNIAKLIANVPFDNLGIPYEESRLTDLDIQKGTILHIDNFGLMKIKAEPLKYRNSQGLKIFKNGEYILDAVYTNRMMSLEDNAWALYSGSSLNNLPELGKVRNKNGYLDIAAKIGDIISWEPT